MPRGAVHVLHNRELDEAGNRFARALDAAGVERGATVGVLGANVPQWMAAHRGITVSGRTITPMSWRWRPDEVAYVIDNCEARALVADARYAHLAEAAAQAGAAGGRIGPEGRFCFGGEVAGFQPWSVVEARSGAALADPEPGSTMFYTSGTTGRPKGVRRQPVQAASGPHALGRAGVRMLRQALPPEDEDGAHLVCTPLYHAGPLTYADGAALLGADLVLLERFDPETVLELIEHHRVVSTYMVPTQFVRLLRLPEDVRGRYDLSSLRAVVHGSAPVAPDVKRAMLDWFGPVLHEFYGGSEGAGSTGISSTEWLDHPGSVGRASPGYTIHVLDEGGRPLPTGATGEVWFAGGQKFEYKDDPEKTAAAHRGELATLGDVGYVDDEGFLYLCDRRADVIISGGVNIYPAQIEAVLVTHPAVADCCVVGVPDDEWGETVHAVVQPVAGATEPALCDDLIALARDRLPGHDVPRTIELRDELPRTETGKLARRSIRDPFWAGRQRRI